MVSTGCRAVSGHSKKCSRWLYLPHFVNQTSCVQRRNPLRHIPLVTGLKYGKLQLSLPESTAQEQHHNSIPQDRWFSHRLEISLMSNQQDCHVLADGWLLQCATPEDNVSYLQFSSLVMIDYTYYRTPKFPTYLTVSAPPEEAAYKAQDSVNVPISRPFLSSGVVKGPVVTKNSMTCRDIPVLDPTP